MKSGLPQDREKLLVCLVFFGRQFRFNVANFVALYFQPSCENQGQSRKIESNILSVCSYIFDIRYNAKLRNLGILKHANGHISVI